jgi:uncharacterized protein
VSSHFGVIGDIHGNFAALDRILARHPEIPFWLCVGDVASAAGTYPEPAAPFYWIKGNNENFDRIAALRSGDERAGNFHYIPNGTAVRIGSLTVAGVGGTFAPTWYETRAADLPHPMKGIAKATELATPSTRSGSSRAKPRDDKRRHFVREEVEACKELRDVDIFMTHEAAKPFRPFPGGRGPDAGKAQINEVLAAMRPRLHLFGHHHRYSEQVVEGVRSIGLDLAERSYLLIDEKTLEITRQP